MKKSAIISLLMLCTLGANAQFLRYEPVTEDWYQNQRQRSYQPQKNREVSYITAYRYTNSGWQKVTLQLTVGADLFNSYPGVKDKYISGYKDKETGHMFEVTCPIKEVDRRFDGEFIYNNFDYKADVHGTTCYF